MEKLLIKTAFLVAFILLGTLAEAQCPTGNNDAACDMTLTVQYYDDSTPPCTPCGLPQTFILLATTNNQTVTCPPIACTGNICDMYVTIQAVACPPNTGGNIPSGTARYNSPVFISLPSCCDVTPTARLSVGPGIIVIGR